MREAAAAFAAAVALAGCATRPGPTIPPAPTPPPVVELDRSGEEDPQRRRARVHTELAAGYYELRSMAVALEEVLIALKADPRYAPAHNVAGLIYADLRKDDLAREHFERALRLDPADPDSNNNYGLYLCERKREAEALKYFIAALKNPLYQHPERSYVNAGLCSRRSGDVAGAERYFLSALKAHPRNPQALYQLADIAYARGGYRQAREYLARLEDVAAPTAEMLWLAVRVERQLGDRNAEAAYGQQLRRQFPDSPEARALVKGLHK